MLEKVSAEAFEEVYRIMKESFPVDERRPYPCQKALFDRENYRVLAIRRENTGEIQAFLAVYELESMIFVEHFAVDQRHRNQGLGALAIRQLIAESDKPVCLEVELPDTEIARRRIGFYERNGLYLTDYSYIQPALAPGQNALPLRLMFSVEDISREAFENARALIYREVYGCGEG